MKGLKREREKEWPLKQTENPITNTAWPALYVEPKLVFRLVMMHSRRNCSQVTVHFKTLCYKTEKQQSIGQSSVYNTGICLYFFLIKVLE